MKKAYPIVLEEAAEGGYIVSIPDFDAHTQGESLGDALFMAKDLIELAAWDKECDGEPIPEPSSQDSIVIGDHEVLTLVAVDFEKMRKKRRTKTVRRSVTVPQWLDEEAREANINVSRVLQEALREMLGYNH